MVRPTTIKPAVTQQQQQIIVIPQSMLNTKTYFTITNNSDIQPKPTLTRVIKPSVPIVKPAMEANKTISLKRCHPQFDTASCSGSDDDYRMEFITDENGQSVRKRANLDHMTTEEKMMRRKLKNRVAAQNARDKKRVLMDDMDVTIRQLQQQNKALARQNEELLAVNRRLIAENDSLKSKDYLSATTTFTTVKKEEPMPYSPERPTSQTPPPSCDEDDDVMTSPALPLEAVDTSSIPVTNPSALAAIAKRQSPVSNRLLVPAEPTYDLQQQDQSRSQAADCKQSAVATAGPQQLACLLWMSLLSPLTALQMTSTSEQTETSSEQMTSYLENSLSMSEERKKSSSSNLPLKKRGNWWGSQQPCPHAKT